MLGYEEGCPHTARGSARLDVHPSGSFTKTYNDLALVNGCDSDDTYFLDEVTLSGTVSGCISQTRIINGNYHFRATEIRDGSSYKGYKKGMLVPRGEGLPNEADWAQFGPRNQAGTMESGIVHFPSPTRMVGGGNISTGVPGSFTWVLQARIEE